jgi:hypothetical protein
MKAGREPENGQDRSDWKIPQLRPDDGVSSSGSSRLAVRLHALEFPKSKEEKGQVLHALAKRGQSVRPEGIVIARVGSSMPSGVGHGR